MNFSHHEIYDVLEGMHYLYHLIDREAECPHLPHEGDDYFMVIVGAI